jgi:hypothetical protein
MFKCNIYSVVILLHKYVTIQAWKNNHSGLKTNFPESWICYVNMYQYHNAILRNNKIFNIPPDSISSWMKYLSPSQFDGQTNQLLLISFRFIPIGTFTFGTSNRQLLAFSVSGNPDMTTDVTFVSFNLYYCHC